ncbi:glycosyltransferase family 87 protein [Novosphingobium sp. M1R2S20]|uniref:Glycosyltransferase family 87 protein n=1 Tax=Novosphingobium rhizovicinum TaxID=3228928 RepID=A0ABV3RBR6_9SPHN
MAQRKGAVQQLATSRKLLLAVILAGVVLVMISAIRFQSPELLGQAKVLTDFDAFHIAGRLAAQGRAADAYNVSTLLQVQREMSGTQSFMPWTYPPPFTLAMQYLAGLPIGAAFVFFALSTFAFYLWVLHRIAGKWLPAVVIAVMPAIVLNLRTGQNGFLIAGLIGWFLLAFRDKRVIAGLPLGLLVIKPHLAAGVGLITLLQRRWVLLGWAGLIGLTLLALSTWIYGISIWMDFRNAVGEAGGFLARGYYPLFRMNSIFAAAYTFGLGATAAMAMQIAGALFALGLLIKASRSRIAYHHLAALTCLASLFVSPYGYDYDLTILGVALAFIVPDLLERCSGLELWVLLLLTWFVCGYGIGWNTAMAVSQPNTGVSLDQESSGLSLIAPVLALLCWALTRILWRQRAEGES